MLFGMTVLLLGKRVYDLYRGELSKACLSCGWRLSHAPNCPARKQQIQRIARNRAGSKTGCLRKLARLFSRKPHRRSGDNANRFRSSCSERKKMPETRIMPFSLAVPSEPLYKS